LTFLFDSVKEDFSLALFRPLAFSSHIIKEDRMIIKALIRVVFILSIFSLPIVAQAACTVYQHYEYSGISYTINSGDVRRFNDVGTEYEDRGRRCNVVRCWHIEEKKRHHFNDIISSVRLDRGCRIKLYEHDDYNGRELELFHDQSELGSLQFNDLASSASCVCAEGKKPVYLKNPEL
jgi:hypothetical protein